MQSLSAPTCTLVLIARDEGPYLIEWIAWHRRLGFDKVVVYDNQSRDGSTELLQRLGRAGIIEWRAWTLGATESPQITAYNDAIKKLRTDWVLFIDTDEFLVLHRHKTVGDFLAGFEGRNLGAIGVNWRIFGDSGMAESDGRPVTQRFTRAAERDFLNNAHIKSFNRRDRITACESMHLCHVRGEVVHASGKPLQMQQWGVTREVEFDVAQVNHYITRTAAEYEDKKRRGRGGFAGDAPEKHNYDRFHFDWHNRNEVEDLCAARQGAQLLAAMAALEKLVAVPA